jgi:endo-1,4-beta-D-glucanase Y
MILKTVIIFMVLALPPAAYGQDNALWEQYKTNFISHDGRVVDYYQGLISHSEGQGYGMSLCVKYGDRPTFEKIWQWTKNNLQVGPIICPRGNGGETEREWSIIITTIHRQGHLIAYVAEGG